MERDERRSQSELRRRMRVEMVRGIGQMGLLQSVG